MHFFVTALVYHNSGGWQKRQECVKIAATMKAKVFLAALVAAEAPEVLVLDELALAMQMGLVSEESGWALIEAGLRYGEVVTTGRSAPESLLAHGRKRSAGE